MSQLMWLYHSGIPGSTVLILTSLGDHRCQQSQPLFKKITSSITTCLVLATVFQNLCRLPENEIHIISLPPPSLFPNMLPWFCHLWCSTQHGNGSHPIVAGGVRFAQFFTVSPSPTMVTLYWNTLRELALNIMVQDYIVSDILLILLFHS